MIRNISTSLNKGMDIKILRVVKIPRTEEFCIPERMVLMGADGQKKSVETWQRIFAETKFGFNLKWPEMPQKIKEAKVKIGILGPHKNCCSQKTANKMFEIEPYISSNNSSNFPEFCGKCLVETIQICLKVVLKWETKRPRPTMAFFKGFFFERIAVCVNKHRKNVFFNPNSSKMPIFAFFEGVLRNFFETMYGGSGFTPEPVF